MRIRLGGGIGPIRGGVSVGRGGVGWGGGVGPVGVSGGAGGRRRSSGGGGYYEDDDDDAAAQPAGPTWLETRAGRLFLGKLCMVGVYLSTIWVVGLAWAWHDDEYSSASDAFMLFFVPVLMFAYAKLCFWAAARAKH